jgi:hypothetical protein
LPRQDTISTGLEGLEQSRSHGFDEKPPYLAGFPKAIMKCSRSDNLTDFDSAKGSECGSTNRPFPQ